jgi:hypothetical protein
MFHPRITHEVAAQRARDLRSRRRRRNVTGSDAAGRGIPSAADGSERPRLPARPAAART